MRVPVFLVLSLAALTAQAAGESADSVQALRAELERLKAAQAEGAVQIQSLESRIIALEAPAPRPGAAGGPAQPHHRGWL